jgi:NTP pyrophosphatase (non-canonical NTP hydrolase)
MMAWEAFRIAEAADYLKFFLHKVSFDAGWWDSKGGVRPQDNPLTFSNKLMLIVSEAAEVMEGDRKDTMDSHLPHRKTVEVEMADLIIRAFDLCGAYDMDIGGAIVEKLAYNQSRADHTPEARAAAGGKKY